MKNLNSLLDKIIDLPATLSLDCKNLSLDTRTLEAGDIFFGLAGGQHDGKTFIKQAFAKGASAVILEAETGHVDTIQNKPVIHIPKLKQHLGTIASRFYDHPEQALDLIGITGTNGKTSCSHYIANALQDYGLTCGIIGTLGYGLYGQLSPLSHTTPDIFTLYRLLNELRNKGAKAVAMEVSSHALQQERIQGLKFKIGIFTNLTQDHLDYHGNLEDYAACKRKLFENYPMEYAIINGDDAVGRDWLQTLQHEKKYIYTMNEKYLEDASHTICAQYFTADMHGIKAGLRSPWGDGVLHSHFLGRFNLYNLLATFSTLCIYQLPLPEILLRLSKLHFVPGRMEKIGGHNQPLVVVDYSHTPDSLEKALQTLKPYCQGELWCVFGCGGNRDKGKRSLMGAIAERYADNIIITDDNPRNEDPKEIVQGILQGLTEQNKAIVEHDRRRAIFHAISCAQQEDIILIAGKGHESYQEIGNKRNPFNDIIEARLALENRIEKL